jgi:predicted RNA-binding Zn ribbon-like protein
MSDPAPGDLELLRSFVNTIDLETGDDQIGTPEQLSEWLAERSLIAGTAIIGEEDHRRALEFREAVRELAIANRVAPLDPSATITLNRVSAEAALAVTFDSEGRAGLRAVGSGLDEALGRLLSIMYTAMVDGTFSRLKGCANDTCRWLFYDQSKNRSKKWCDMQACGNVVNARAYRRRHQHEPANGG